jgi:hypothetical protein
MNAMLEVNLIQGVDIMTSHRILQLNAVSTAACAAAMLIMRGTLHTFFGLASPMLLDVIAVGLLAYAAVLALAAQRRPIGRQVLMFFTIADAIWVGGSALVLLMFWGQLMLSAKVLIVAVALVVEVFATLQFRAAGKLTGAASSVPA